MLLQVEFKRIEEWHVLRTVDDPKDAEEDGKPGGDTLAEETQYGKCGFKGRGPLWRGHIGQNKVEDSKPFPRPDIIMTGKEEAQLN